MYKINKVEHFDNVPIKFVQIEDNKYVMNRNDPCNDSFHKVNSSYYTTFYTPTHIVTYPNGDPFDFREIKEIFYTKSNVTFHKDFSSNKCCIDIYDEKTNPNKCRIIGENGGTIVTSNYICIETYEVSQESNCFKDNKPRLIYVNHNGLYIVSKEDNPIAEAMNSCFNGEVIEISAITGQRKISGFDESNEIFIYNCPSHSSVAYKVEPTPIMEQIEEITGVKLVTPQPNEQSALKRMADIFNIPVELLVMQNGKACIIPSMEKSPSPPNNSTTSHDNRYAFILFRKLGFTLKESSLNLWKSYIDQLEKYLPIANNVNEKDQAKACGIIQSQEISTYEIPTEDQRKKIALQSWPIIEKYDTIFKQIEKISGVIPQTLPPSENSVLKRVSELLDIPKDLLKIIDEKVYMIYVYRGVLDEKLMSIPRKYTEMNNENQSINKNWRNCIDQFIPFIPPISSGISVEELSAALLVWKDVPEFKYDESEEAKNQRKEMALKPWDNV